MEIAKRLIPRKIARNEIDSVKARQAKVGRKRDMQLLERCERLWDNLDDFRKQRARAMRFTYGDQWGDLIEVNGKTMTQRQYLLKQGNVTLQTNQIKNKVDTIVGVVVKEENEPVCNAHDRSEQQYGEVVTVGLQANCDKNEMSALNIQFMKELCIGGLCVARESYDSINGPTGRLDSWTLYVNPNQIFFDSEMVDPRFWDAKIIGQFFDKSFGEVAAMFAHRREDYATLKDIYPNQSLTFVQEDLNQITDKHDERDLVFRNPDDTSKCRVFEVWTYETRPRIRLYDTNSPAPEEIVIDEDDYAYRRQVCEENERRKRIAKDAGWSDDAIPYITGDGYGVDDADRNGFFVDTYWYCRFLAPDGTILWEGESPYADGLHPFSLCGTPMMDGRIVGYMNDAIDHNIAMNRAVVLHDWLVRSQAKGVTVVPKAIVPKDVSLGDFANSWTSIDDIVYIDLKPGQEKLMPQVFHGTAQTFNVSELLNTYSKLMENSTAITGAIQGKTPYSGTSGNLYAQQANNATTTIAGLLKQFHLFMENVARKKLKNLVAFYEPSRWEDIAGNIDGIFGNANLRLNRVQDIEFDLKIRESTETPVYRAIVNQDAKEFLLAGLVSFEEYLKIANVPYADSILQMRQARQAEAESAQRGEVPQSAIEQAAAEGTLPQQQPASPNIPVS